MQLGEKSHQTNAGVERCKLLNTTFHIFELPSLTSPGDLHFVSLTIYSSVREYSEQVMAYNIGLVLICNVSVDMISVDMQCKFSPAL